jgi:hypothetical protein
MSSKMNIKEAPSDQYYFTDAQTGDIVFKNSANTWVFGEGSNSISTLRFDQATTNLNSEVTKINGQAIFNSNVGIWSASHIAPLEIKTGASDVPNENGVVVYNEGTDSNSHAIIALAVNGSNAGDAFVSFTANQTDGWSVGFDNSDNGNFKIANTWNDLSSNTRVTINASGKIGIGKSHPTEALHIDGRLNATGISINNQPLSTTVGGGFQAKGNSTSYTTCNIGIGLSNPSAPLQISARASTVPEQNGLLIFNSNTSSTSHAIATVSVAGSTAGDW